MLGRTSECPVHSPLGVGGGSASPSLPPCPVCLFFLLCPREAPSWCSDCWSPRTRTLDLGPSLPGWRPEQGHVSKPLPSQAGIMGGAPHSPWSSPRQLLPPPVPWVQRWGPKRPAPQTPGIRSALDQSRPLHLGTSRESSVQVDRSCRGLQSLSTHTWRGSPQPGCRRPSCPWRPAHSEAAPSCSIGCPGGSP